MKTTPRNALYCLATLCYLQCLIGEIFPACQVMHICTKVWRVFPSPMHHLATRFHDIQRCSFAWFWTTAALALTNEIYFIYMAEYILLKYCSKMKLSLLSLLSLFAFHATLKFYPTMFQIEFVFSYKEAEKCQNGYLPMRLQVIKQ